MTLVEPVEHDDFVDAVDELGLEVLMNRGHHGTLVTTGAEVARHDEHGVGEVHRAALTIGQSTVVHQRQQDIEHIGVSLLHLVQQDDGVGPTANGLGELTAFVVPDVARRRADQTRHGVLLHVLTHVDANHRPLVVEQEVGEGAREFGLADARRTQEQEGSDRLVRVG